MSQNKENLTKEALQEMTQVIDEINTVAPADPPFRGVEIKKSFPAKEDINNMLEDLKEGIELLEVDEAEEFSKEAVAYIRKYATIIEVEEDELDKGVFKFLFPNGIESASKETAQEATNEATNEAKTEPEGEVPVEEIKKEVDEAEDLHSLKDIVKVYPQFKGVRGLIGSFKSKEALQKELLSKLGYVPVKEKEQEAKQEKTEKEQKPKQEAEQEKPKQQKAEKKEPKKSGGQEKTKFGHIKGTFSGAIDEALINANEVLTTQQIMDKTGCKEYKVAAHIRHLKHDKFVTVHETDKGYELEE